MSRGKYSASGMERVMLCPGSVKACEGLPETPSEYSESGDLIHAAWAGSSDAQDKLTTEQVSAWENLERKTSALVSELGFDNCPMEFEQRLYSTTLPLSGQSDRTYRDHANKRSLILDGKTGWGDVPTSVVNMQLRTLAVLEFQATGHAEIIVAIVASWKKGDAPVVYYPDDIQAAELELVQIIARAESPEAPRIPGEAQCKYCRARFQCPERLALLQSTALVKVEAAFHLLTNKQKGFLLVEWKRIKKIGEDLEEDVKARLTRGETVPGWTLKPGEPRDKIINLPVIHARAEALGITTEQFTAACSLTKKAAKEMVQAATAKKGEALEAEVESLIDGCTQPGRNPEPSLVRLTEPKE